MKMVHKINCMNCKHSWQTNRYKLLIECPNCEKVILNRLDQLRNFKKTIIFNQLKKAKLEIIGD